MSPGADAPATLPPPGLTGLDPSWSRLVTAPDAEGIDRTWHLLDNGVADPAVTLLCVHGNPTWSYLFRRAVAEAPPDVRVIAVDQLNMGYSERTGEMRRLQQRVADLDALTASLEIDSPIVTLGHDWGGAVSLGWAVRNAERLAGVVLMNTAVHQPAGSPAPTLIRMARGPGVLRPVTEHTAVFLDGALAMARPRLDRDVRDAFRAPYATAPRRRGIGDFVEDIPLDPAHPSDAALRAIASGLEALADIPVLMLWGPADPVFSDRYLNDLVARLPHADVHRFEGAGHLVTEDADAVGAALSWVATLHRDPVAASATAPDRPVWSAIEARRDDTTTAVVEMGGDARPDRRLTFSELATDVERIGAGLAELGVQPGSRVGLLIPPGLDLNAVLYACWRIGAVVVVVDAGLGIGGIGRALKSAAPDVLIGIPRALAAARALRWPGRRIVTGPAPAATVRALGAVTLDEVRRVGRGRTLPPGPTPEAPAAVAFTSGSTGPAKGVRYRHHQLQAQRDALRQTYAIGPDDRLVAAFGPFALYGPALGIASAVPAMDVTAPGTLTAAALGDAVEAVGATMVFASPAALTNVVATTAGLDRRTRAALNDVRLVMSAGAPVSAELLRNVAAVTPNAEIHTPYGMTEALPIADVTLDEIDAAGDGTGVCVGHPLPTVEVAILPIDQWGRPGDTLVGDAAVVGEVCVRAPHMKDAYDRLWVTDHATARPPGWHRSGDVGHLDGEGRLWIEGRMAHLIVTADGPVTPVGLEHDAETVPGIRQAAAVGVGPVGAQQIVLVASPTTPIRRPGPAGEDLADAVRRATAADIAAVLLVPELPTDKRHNSKIERSRIAAWANRALAGGRIRRL